MLHSWTFSQKIGAGFVLGILFTLIVSITAMVALKNVIETKDYVITVYGQALVDAQRISTSNIERRLATRGYFLDPNPQFLEEIRQEDERYQNLIHQFRENLPDPQIQKLLNEVEEKVKDHTTIANKVIDMRKNGGSMETVVKAFNEEMEPRRESVKNALKNLVMYIEQQRDQAKLAANLSAEKSSQFVLFIAIVAVLSAILIAVFLARTLTRQIGSGVQHLQSSSNELQAAATQQASGAKEQASAMSEISTTISELLATSKQIAEGAQRVAHIAEETANAARLGNDGLQKSQQMVTSIKKQVDLIVNHMLDLGKKSQQIGGILEIINELAEQTNILAINATIEAAGAGEVGKRFSVVADEIRKLADRVGGSTKEIRTLIDEIRAAVNTTVMTTEGGTKTVDAGVKQILDVTTMFQQIVDLVGTTTEASREIELSTKQQSTAVEQVTIAIANVTQATKEAEVSSNQTLQTAAQLTGLSRDLARIVQSQMAA